MDYTKYTAYVSEPYDESSKEAQLLVKYKQIDTLTLLKLYKQTDYESVEYNIIRNELETRACPFEEEKVYLSDGVSVDWITAYIMGL
jgi:hypothetical protein